MTKIKICGLRREEDIAMVNEYRPDYVGFILAKGRRRTINEVRLRSLRQQLCREIQAVGVFVNQDKEWIVRLLEEGIIDVVQLHGQEKEDEIAWIKAKTERPVIKAVSVQSSADIKAWRWTTADYLLLDQGIGGTGKTFDWAFIKEVRKPFFLAGGINETNLYDALKQSPAGIDISSGVETGGYKDREKIRNIIELVRKEA